MDKLGRPGDQTKRNKKKDISYSDQNEAPERNLASDDDAPASLALIYPNSGRIVFSDDIWMVDIPGVYQDIDILQVLILSGSLATDNL